MNKSSERFDDLFCGLRPHEGPWVVVPGGDPGSDVGFQCGDAGAQAERIFEIIHAVLAAHGAGFADVLHIRTFMTDLDDLPAYGAVRRRLFPADLATNPPASTTVEVRRLFLPGAVLEVEVTAAVRTPA